MGRTLIVANQTLGGDELDRVVRDRIARGRTSFHIVVPSIPPGLEAGAWAGLEAGVVPLPPPEAVDDVRHRSEERLAGMIDRIQEAGGTATGEIGNSNPGLAVRDMLDREEFGEVIVSTLPAGISRWLKMDLPSRVRRMTDVHVTVVEAESTD